MPQRKHQRFSWQIQESSDLAASPQQLWEHIGTMAGVNEELMPWIDMTAPQDATQFRIEDAPLGTVVLRSWLRLGGVVPFDRHALRFVHIAPEQQFIEESTSWMQRRWRHERTLEPSDVGCRIIDTVTFTPRLPILGPIVRPTVAALFAHRHRCLRKRFGV